MGAPRVKSPDPSPIHDHAGIRLTRLESCTGDGHAVDSVRFDLARPDGEELGYFRGEFLAGRDFRGRHLTVYKLHYPINRVQLDTRHVHVRVPD